jgi:hypothetical protein
LLAVPDYQALHDRLTRMVKDRAPAARVLGAGEASDSRRRLSEAGVQDICVPQLELALSVGCDSEACRLVSLGRSDRDTRRVERALAADAAQREFRVALTEVVDEQLAYLIEAH